jgi:hypothetical protein
MGQRIHQRWAELYSHARNNGMAIQHDHNDVWIAATAHVAGLKLLSTDCAAFPPLRRTAWVNVVVLDPKDSNHCAMSNPQQLVPNFWNYCNIL